MPAGWVIRITMPDQFGVPGLPMFYAAMFPAPSKAVEAVKWHRHSPALGEKYEAVKNLGKLYIERRNLVAGDVVEISQ